MTNFKNMKKLSFYFCTCLFLCISLPINAYGIFQGKEVIEHNNEEKAYTLGLHEVFTPFYAGPLLAPSAVAVPFGKANDQPYVNWQKNYKKYNRQWRAQNTTSSVQLSFINVLQMGVTNFMQLSVVNSGIYNQKKDQRSFNYADINVQLGLQLWESVFDTLVPSVLIQAGVVLPTGKWQKLNPNKLGTDITGTGSVGAIMSLNFQKIHYAPIFKQNINPENFHPLRLRAMGEVTIFGPSHVRGHNAFGGTHTTVGKVKQGVLFRSIFAWEYSLSQNWVFSTDWQYQVQGRSEFFGKNAFGTMDPIVQTQNFSVAPALQYNFSSSFGMLLGVQFSFAGKNSNSFATGIFTFTGTF